MTWVLVERQIWETASRTWHLRDRSGAYQCSPALTRLLAVLPSDARVLHEVPLERAKRSLPPTTYGQRCYACMIRVREFYREQPERLP